MRYTFEELVESKLSEFENATGMFLHKNRELVKKELVDMCRNVKALTKRECSEALAETENDYWWENSFSQIDEFTIEI
jgi:hypothetical protein